MNRVLVAAAIAASALVSGAFAQRPRPASVTFEDVAAARGLAFTHVNGATPDRHLLEIMSGGGLLLDYDNDGWLDALLVDGGSLVDRATAARARHRLFRNRGNGTFEDATAAAGIAHAGYGMGACAADYDNDGWLDVYVTNVGRNVLYRGDRGRGFRDVTPAAGVGGGPEFSASCAFGDVDRDGDVDLFVVNYVDARIDNNLFCGNTAKKIRTYCHPLNFRPLSDVLYRNDGDGTFTDITAAAGIRGRGNGLGVVMGDYDDDGWLDVFVANDTTPNFLYRNRGNGTFEDVALISGVSVASDGQPRAGMGTDFGDYDGDGRLDLFVTNHEFETHTLFRNTGDGLFQETTAGSGVGMATRPFVGFGTVFFDYDNDADLDLAVANGHVMNSPEHFRAGAKEAQRNLLLQNDGRGRFRDAGAQSGGPWAVEKVSRGLAAGDIDNDGDLDVLITNNGDRVELLRNDGGAAAGNALLLRLTGTQSNRSAVGARVRLSAGGRTQLREVKAGSSYLSQDDLRVHVGLGALTAVERVEIRWPNGTTETLNGVAANQIVTVVEGKGITARTPLR